MKKLLMLCFVGIFSLTIASSVFATQEYECPFTAEAVGGYIVPQGNWTMTLEPNNPWDGTVSLISHFDRPWADYDINPLPDGRVQLMCIYKNDADVQIGGLSMFAIPEDENLPYACHPLYAGFWCQVVFE